MIIDDEVEPVIINIERANKSNDLVVDEKAPENSLVHDHESKAKE